MMGFANKMAQHYIMRFLNKAYGQFKLINKFKLAKRRVKKSVQQFKNHCRKKKEAYERLAMVFYEELEGIKSWEDRVICDVRPHVDFIISENMDVYNKENVDKVLNRYIDYELLDFSISKVTPVCLILLMNQY